MNINLKQFDPTVRYCLKTLISAGVVVTECDTQPEPENNHVLLKLSVRKQISNRKSIGELKTQFLSMKDHGRVSNMTPKLSTNYKDIVRRTAASFLDANSYWPDQDETNKTKFVEELATRIQQPGDFEDSMKYFFHYWYRHV